MDIEVSQTAEKEIIHPALFHIFKILVLFPVFLGFEPPDPTVLVETRTTELKIREHISQKKIHHTQNLYLRDNLHH